MTAVRARAWLEAELIRRWQSRGLATRTLWPLSRLYGRVAEAQRRRMQAQAVPIGRPTVVVGNRIVGGAGKTPTVLALLAHLKTVGWQPGVVSRGHGRDAADGVQLVDRQSTARQVGDEPLLVHLRGQVPVAVGRDRVAAARALLAAQPGIDLLLCDDGLQHRRLARDVEVVVFDSRGAGNGWLLPAGPLREPLDLPSMAHTTLVLYNAEAPSTGLPGFMATRGLTGAVALSAWWRGEPATPAVLAALRGQPVVACAGVARPQAFFAQLRALGLQIDAIGLPDHARFDRLPWPAAARHVVVTEKDAVKLDPERVARERPQSQVWVAPLDFQPAPPFFAALDVALAIAAHAPAPNERPPWTHA